MPFNSCHASITCGVPSVSNGSLLGRAPVASTTASARLAPDHVEIDGRAGDDLRSGPLRLARQIADDAAELRATGQQLSEVHLAADPRRRLVQRDLVAALGSHRCCLQPARAASHHQYLARP